MHDSTSVVLVRPSPSYSGIHCNQPEIPTKVFKESGSSRSSYWPNFSDPGDQRKYENLAIGVTVIKWGSQLPSLLYTTLQGINLVYGVLIRG